MDEVLSLWTQWSACPVSCGLGYRLRSRSCITPTLGGKPCVAQLEDTDPCIVGNCPGRFTCVLLNKTSYNLLLITIISPALSV